MSLPKVYISRNLTADQLRKQNVLSISNTPAIMLQPTLSGELPCEFLSLETMHRWILCELVVVCVCVWLAIVLVHTLCYVRMSTARVRRINFPLPPLSFPLPLPLSPSLPLYSV